MRPNLEKLFRAYDIRGVYGKDFGDSFYCDFGRAFVAWLAKAKRAPRPRVFVVQDVRPSSPRLTRALVQGLQESGARVTNAGMEPTPVLYYLLWRYPRTGGVAVTASHNPSEYNGLKPGWNRIVLTQEEQQAIRRTLETRAFRTGKGSVEKRRFEAEFLAHATRGLRCKRRLRVVVDAGNGSCGPLALKLVRKLGATPIPLHCEPIPGFPNHQPDPLKAENVRDLQERVVTEGADLGIAFDGDGDRVAFIDEKGGALSSDDALILFMRDLAGGPRFRKAESVIYNLVMSNAIPEEARRLGARPHMTPVGHTHIHHAMLKRKGLVAGEPSGHFFFRENGSYDDAFHAAARFLHLASRFEGSLSEARRTLPRYYATPSFYIECADEEKFGVVAAIRSSLEKSYNTLTMDGVRIELLRSWGVVRASNTKPELNLRFEGESLNELREAYRIIERELTKHKLKLPPLESLVIPPGR